jgi:hypothetical protein
MAFETAAINSMLDHLGTEVTYGGLIGTDGSAEVIGGTPAYARKVVTWGAASGKSMVGVCTSLVFDVPAGTINKVILMSAITGGITYNTITVTGETFAAQGTYTVTALGLSGS